MYILRKKEASKGEERNKGKAHVSSLSNEETSVMLKCFQILTWRFLS